MAEPTTDEITSLPASSASTGSIDTNQGSSGFMSVLVGAADISAGGQKRAGNRARPSCPVGLARLATVKTIRTQEEVRRVNRGHEHTAHKPMGVYVRHRGDRFARRNEEQRR
jgi:hypothetical protein